MPSWVGFLKEATNIAANDNLNSVVVASEQTLTKQEILHIV